MKTIIIIATIIAITTSSFGKTRKMTMSQYQLAINKIDSNVVGTWKKNWTLEQKSKNEFCQFKANGTFLAFKTENNTYTVTGRGNWQVKNGIITILHANEKTSAVKYESNGKYLSFENNVTYSKPALIYANK